jgi:hypothetical protein
LALCTRRFRLSIRDCTTHNDSNEISDGNEISDDDAEAACERRPTCCSLDRDMRDVVTAAARCTLCESNGATAVLVKVLYAGLVATGSSRSADGSDTPSRDLPLPSRHSRTKKNTMSCRKMKPSPTYAGTSSVSIV